MTIKPEHSERLNRHYRRRPDRHPFIVEVPSSIFFATRAMSQINTRYPVVVGESFWRLAAYVDSVPSRLEERVAGRPPHIMMRGKPGSGKSYLMAAASALLGFGPASVRPQQLHYLAADYRTIFIGDCRRWLESDDPLTYFRMELLAGFRDSCHETGPEEDHLGCLVCVEPFTRVDQVRQFMERCCRVVQETQPDTLLVFFIDQAEELIGRESSIPFQIIQTLLNVQSPLLVFSVATPLDSDFPFKNQCGVTIDIPYRVTSAEFAKHLEVHSTNSGSDENGTTTTAAGYKDVHWWKEMRLWTGSVPLEIAELAKMPGTGMAGKLGAYRRQVAHRTGNMLIAISKLEGRQRNVLLIVLFAVILRVPMDMSGEFNLGNVLALGPAITNPLLLNCLQAFYHTSDGIITMRDVPAAISMAAHLALTSANTLNAVIRTWPTLFENVVHAMMASRLLCAEAKRRLSRFYAHAKFLWGRPNWSIDNGMTEFGEIVRIRFRQPRVVIFASQTPPPTFMHPNGPDAEHHGVPGNGDYDAVVFLPGRTSYWFFDFFILIPEERRLYAITTSAVVGTWLKELQTRAGPMNLTQQRDDGLLTPLVLLDHWRDTLKKAGLPKVSVKCCVLKTLDLMTAAGYTPPPEENGVVGQLAQQLESSAVLTDDQ
jgi:hypothetical protein